MAALSALAVTALVCFAFAHPAPPPPPQPQKTAIVVKTKSAAAQPPPQEHKDADSSSEDSNEFEEEWQCGSETFSKLISRENWIIAEQMIVDDCPHLLHDFNQCCIGHDGCYDAQTGQLGCDAAFCACLERVTSDGTNATRVCHDEHSPWFCQTVRQFGSSFYAASNVSVTTLNDDAENAQSADDGGSGDLTAAVAAADARDANAQLSVRPKIYESKNYNVERALQGVHAELVDINQQP